MTPTIVFDLDGTLVNTAPDLANATNYVLQQAGHGMVTIDELRGMLGQGARKMIECGFARSGATVETAEMETLFAHFLTHYQAHIADHSQPYPGMMELVDKIRSTGWKTAICTNKMDALSHRLINALGLQDQFDAIVGPNAINIAKPDPAPLFEAINRAGGSADHAVLIGDSKTDIETGKNAKIPVIAVSYGYTDIPVAEFSPDYVVDHADDIWPVLENLFATGTPIN